MYMYTTARILSRHSRKSTDCYTSSYRITSNPLAIHEYILIMVMLTLYRCYLENFCPPSVWHCYCYKLLNNLSIIAFWLDASGGTKIFRVSHQKIWSFFSRNFGSRINFSRTKIPVTKQISARYTSCRGHTTLHLPNQWKHIRKLAHVDTALSAVHDMPSEWRYFRFLCCGGVAIVRWVCSLLYYVVKDWSRIWVLVTNKPFNKVSKISILLLGTVHKLLCQPQQHLSSRRMTSLNNHLLTVLMVVSFGS